MIYPIRIWSLNFYSVETVLADLQFPKLPIIGLDAVPLLALYLKRFILAFVSLKSPSPLSHFVVTVHLAEASGLGREKVENLPS